MFLGVVGLVVLAAALLAPVVPTLRKAETAAAEPTSRSRLVWSVVAAVMVLAVELLGSTFALAAVPAIVLVLVAVRPLTPRGTLVAGRGLPSVIGTRGLMSARSSAARPTSCWCSSSAGACRRAGPGSR